MNILDVVIIGGGPIGMACGIECSKKRLSYIIIEKGALVNSIYNYPLNMNFFSTSDKLEIGDVPFISNNPKPTRSEALEYYRRVAIFWKLNIHLYETVNDVEKSAKYFVINTSKQTYSANNIIIATGFYDIPNLMHVPGENLPKVHHYYKEPHIYFGQKIVVIGAANSAVDVAMETWRKGADVTMIIRDEHIRDSVKYWIKPDIENRIKEGSIKAYYNSSLISIGEKTVTIKCEEGEKVLENDFVLAMTGYLPDFQMLTSLGITFGNDEFKTPNYDSETIETNVKGIYLAGVICGGLKTNKWFIENSRIHANMIIDNILCSIENS
jgi:putative YpdA family bacillithiol system oxidoreductase